MRIGLVCPYDYNYPGGVATHIAHLAEQFFRRGHTVRVIAPTSGRPPDSPGADNVIRLGRPVPVPGRGSIARISLSVWLGPRVRSVLESHAFDLVHLHEPLAPILPLMVLRVSRTVNVGTFHAFHGSTRLYWASHRLLQGSFARLDGRIAVSRPALDYVSRHFPGDYRLIPNGIDVDHFSNRAEPLEQYRDGKLNILFVGRQEKRKGLKYLLAAMSAIAWRRSDVRLIVVGPGHPDSDCQRMLGERHLPDVVFAGPVPYDALPRYYATASVFCSPATGSESFGVVLLEAMAAGVPVVASDIEGYSSVIEPNRDGLLVPPRRERQLAEALETALDDGDARRRLAAHAAAKIQRFRWEQVAGEVLEYYGELVDRRNREPEAPQ